MYRRVTPPKRVTSPTWGPPPPCKKALKLAKLQRSTWPQQWWYPLSDPVQATRSPFRRFHVRVNSMPGSDNSGHNCLHSKLLNIQKECCLYFSGRRTSERKALMHVLAAIIVLFYIPVSVLLNG